MYLYVCCAKLTNYIAVLNIVILFSLFFNYDSVGSPVFSAI